MSPSLSVLVLSLVVGASPWENLLSRQPPTNAERAKRGLLPRRSTPSRVAYLDGAARRKGEVKEFPAGGASAARSAPIEVAASEASAVSEPSATASSAAASERVTASSAPEPQAQVATPEPADEAPAVAPASRAVARSERGAEPAAKEPPTPAEVREEEAADRARDAASASEAMVVERAVDARGWIVERRRRSDLAILSVRVVGSVDQLPVLASQRLADGDILERVEDRAGLLEVRRDPVGRFRSARALPAPSDDEGD